MCRKASCCRKYSEGCSTWILGALESAAKSIALTVSAAKCDPKIWAPAFLARGRRGRELARYAFVAHEIASLRPIAHARPRGNRPIESKRASELIARNVHVNAGTHMHDRIIKREEGSLFRIPFS